MRVQNREILQFFIFYSKLKILHFQGRQFLPKLYKMRNRNLSFNPPLFHRIGISRSGETLKLPLIKRVELTVISRGEARGVVSRRRLDLDAWFRGMKARFAARTLLFNSSSAVAACSSSRVFITRHQCRPWFINPPVAVIVTARDNRENFASNNRGRRVRFLCWTVRLSASARFNCEINAFSVITDAMHDRMWRIPIDRFFSRAS